MRRARRSCRSACTCSISPSRSSPSSTSAGASSECTPRGDQADQRRSLASSDKCPEVTCVRDILEPIVKWWTAGETFGLATVVRTFSSAPRDPGAALAVSPTGEVVGSVSGGCVEGAVYEVAQEVCGTGEPVLQTYGVSDGDALAVGLTCGGTIEIFVEPVNKSTFPELGDITAAVERGDPVTVATIVSGPGSIGARRVSWPRTASGGLGRE